MLQATSVQDVNTSTRSRHSGWYHKLVEKLWGYFFSAQSIAMACDFARNRTPRFAITSNPHLVTWEGGGWVLQAASGQNIWRKSAGARFVGNTHRRHWARREKIEDFVTLDLKTKKLRPSSGLSVLISCLVARQRNVHVESSVRAPYNTTSGRDCVKSLWRCLHWICPQTFPRRVACGLLRGNEHLLNL